VGWSSEDGVMALVSEILEETVLPGGDVGVTAPLECDMRTGAPISMRSGLILAPIVTPCGEPGPLQGEFEREAESTRWNLSAPAGL